jgi:peroxiredoxin
VENRHYVELYRRYRDAGFEILAVSVDQSGPAWKAAIAKDRATWRHLSDLTGWKTPLAAAYNVAALPASFLIDPTGKIIAKDLRGSRLTTELERVFPRPAR